MAGMKPGRGCGGSVLAGLVLGAVIAVLVIAVLL